LALGVISHIRPLSQHGLHPGAPRWRRLPAYSGKFLDPASWHENAFGSQQRFLERYIAPEAADRAPCGNHAVRRDTAIAATAHDVPDRS
jgi:hypothetical protein